MTPRSFDPITCRSIVGDERARLLEARAREDADSADLDEPGAAYRPPAAGEGTYWDQVRSESEIRTYWQAFQKRIERRRRKAHSINPRRPDGGTTLSTSP